MDTVRAERHGDKIWVNADFTQKDMILTLPGARWNREEGVCVLNLTYASCKQLRSILGEELEIGDALYEWAVNEVQSRVEPSLQLRQATQVPNFKADERLYPYQKAGAQFLITAQHALLGDEMGSGKTATAITAAKTANSLPALVVCPNSTKHSWRREIETWWPEAPVEVVEGTKKNRQETILNTKGWCIINWESVRLFSRLAPYGSMRLSEEDRTPKELNEISWELIIVDEAHRMKDPTSKQTRAIWALGY